MNETKTMKQLHAIRESHYEKLKHMSIKEQINAIRAEAEPVKKELLAKMKRGKTGQLR